MTNEERDCLFALCEKIAREKDHSGFLKLIRELNDLLNHQESRLSRGRRESEEKE